jgi:hypothetical protein
VEDGKKKSRMGYYLVFLNRKTTQKNIGRTGPGLFRKPEPVPDLIGEG